jgi:hypothetical protein
MSDFILPGKDGKPIFIGQEDPHNPPVKKPSGSLMTCPVCGKEVDYLVGDDTEDGGKQGCESCWVPPKKGVKHESEETKKTVFD